MGQYKLAIYFKLFQFGFNICWKKKESVEISLPFILVYIGLLSDAKGVYYETCM